MVGTIIGLGFLGLAESLDQRLLFLGGADGVAQRTEVLALVSWHFGPPRRDDAGDADLALSATESARMNDR